MSLIPGFDDGLAKVNGQTIAYSISGYGSGPALLLLHGYPQMRAMWRSIAPLLAQRFTVVAGDLRGYGDSSKPEGLKNYSFRDMAADQRALMQHLGFDRFHLVGHDRGARTAHRMALDAPEAVASLTLMDIVPTHLLLNDLTQQVARGYYHWFFLAQPAPLPEKLIGADPDYYFESCLTGWDQAGLEAWDAQALAQYRRCWRDPAMIAGSTNDYRAAVDVDFALDAADLDRRVTCPALVMYGADGPMAKAYDVPGTWADRLTDITTAPMPGGHFFPDLHPDKVAQALLEFLPG